MLVISSRRVYVPLPIGGSLKPAKRMLKVPLPKYPVNQQRQNTEKFIGQYKLLSLMNSAIILLHLIKIK